LKDQGGTGPVIKMPGMTNFRVFDHEGREEIEFTFLIIAMKEPRIGEGPRVATGFQPSRQQILQAWKLLTSFGIDPEVPPQGRPPHIDE